MWLFVWNDAIIRRQTNVITELIFNDFGADISCDAGFSQFSRRKFMNLFIYKSRQAKHVQNHFCFSQRLYFLLHFLPLYLSLSLSHTLSFTLFSSLPLPFLFSLSLYQPSDRCTHWFKPPLDPTRLWSARAIAIRHGWSFSFCLHRCFSVSVQIIWTFCFVFDWEDHLVIFKCNLKRKKNKRLTSQYLPMFT